MNITNNNISSPNFGALSYYRLGRTVDRAELMCRDAEYSHIVDELESSSIKPAIKEKHSGISAKLDEIDAEIKLNEMLMALRKDTPETQAPSSTPYSRGVRAQIIDIKA